MIKVQTRAEAVLSYAEGLQGMPALVPQDLLDFTLALPSTLSNYVFHLVDNHVTAQQLLSDVLEDREGRLGGILDDLENLDRDPADPTLLLVENIANLLNHSERLYTDLINTTGLIAKEAVVFFIRFRMQRILFLTEVYEKYLQVAACEKYFNASRGPNAITDPDTLMYVAKAMKEHSIKDLETCRELRREFDAESENYSFFKHLSKSQFQQLTYLIRREANILGVVSDKGVDDTDAVENIPLSKI